MNYTRFWIAATIFAFLVHERLANGGILIFYVDSLNG